jgi:hypothetical protein
MVEVAGADSGFLADASVAWQAQNLNAAREAYLAYHRENVFLAG